jgi:hypothetical protein
MAFKKCPDVSESDIVSGLVYSVTLSPPNDELFASTLHTKYTDESMVHSLSLVDSNSVMAMFGWIERSLGPTVSPLKSWFLTKETSNVEMVRANYYNI